ncbi:GtrA family protein [Acidocella sp.]|jgi:putative flippase GtrA|uniref:GtrA family protein n=1 Tax=Acidocella sp. TaxID=50710 RepID=UPI002F42C666
MSRNSFARQVLSLLDAGVVLLARTGLSQDFIRFGAVGALGFCWDTATVYATRNHFGLYVAGTLGFFVAATVNWAINRWWTFRHHTHGAAHVQWLKFLATNLVGFIFNRGTFFALVAISPLCRAQPVLAIVAGTASGLVFNYFLSKKLVFR